MAFLALVSSADAETDPNKEEIRTPLSNTSGTPISIANKFTQTGTCAIDIKTNTIDLTNAEAVTGTYLANITGTSWDYASGSHTLTAVDATSGKIIKTWTATIPISNTPSGFELNDVPREWELPEGVSDVSNVYFRLQISGTITAGKILYRSNGSEYAAAAWLIYTGSKIHVEVPETPYFSGFPGDGNLTTLPGSDLTAVI